MKLDNLRERTVRGSLAAGGVVMIIRPLNIVATIFLARLLDPSDFGMVALAMLLVSSSYIFTTLGMGPALVHSSEDEPKAAFHAFVITMLSSSVFTLTLLIFARPIAALLGDVSVEPVLRWLSLLLVLESLFLVPNAILRRHLMFERISSIRFVSQLLSILTSLSLAFAGFGYWSLVVAKIVGELLQFVLSWILCPNKNWWRPSAWNTPLARELLGYGSQGMAAGISTYVHTHADDWMVGRFLGVSALGYYTKAYDLSNKTLTNLGTDMIGNVFFPSYRKIRDNLPRLTRAYVKSISYVTLLMTPIALGMFVVAPIAVPVLLGEKWLPMTPVLQIYSLMVLTRPISENTHPLFLALGKPVYSFWAGILLTAVMLPLAILGLRWGIVGVTLAVTISHVVGSLFNVYQANTLLPTSAKSSLLASWPPLLAGVVMVLVVQICKTPLLSLLDNEVDLLYLFLLAVLGAATYILVTLMLQRSLVLELRDLLRNSLVRRKALRSTT